MLLQPVVCAVILVGTAMAADGPYSCRVGDKVDGWNVDWYAATVMQIGSGDHAGYCFLKWDKFSTPTWIKSANIRARPRTGIAASAAASSAPPPAKYSCGIFLNNAFTYTQTLTLKDDGSYQSTAGASGRYRFDPAARQIAFDGGALRNAFGRYEAENKQIIRVAAKEDAGASAAAQTWRSQVCSPQQ